MSGDYQTSVVIVKSQNVKWIPLFLPDSDRSEFKSLLLLPPGLLLRPGEGLLPWGGSSWSISNSALWALNLLPEWDHWWIKFSGQDSDNVSRQTKNMGGAHLNTIHRFFQNDFVMEITSTILKGVLPSFVFPHSHYTLIFPFFFWYWW